LAPGRHFLPGKGESYPYAPLRLVRVGSLDFITDTKVLADYGKRVMNPDSLNGSDQSRAGALLRGQGYRSERQRMPRRG
jgi:hypothetical protein